MTKSTIDKNNKKKEVAKKLQNCSHICSLCGESFGFDEAFYKELFKRLGIE
jgi:hypothetical protein